MSGERTQRRQVHFRNGDNNVAKLNALAERYRGLWMLLGWVVAILASVGTTVSVMRTDLGYASSVPGRRLDILESRMDSVTDYLSEQNQIIRALGADWCFRANDTVRAVSSVSCYDLTRGIRR